MLNAFKNQWNDFNYNQCEGVISKYCKARNILFEEYIRQIQNDQILQKVELERLKFFLLTYNQKLVVSFCPNGSGKGKDEKLFLGFEHSERKKYEGINPFPNNKTGKINSKLYTDDDVFDETKVSSYIYKSFLGENIDGIHETLKTNIYKITLDKLINWEEVQYKQDKTTKQSTQSIHSPFT
jgi:type I restriction enzyme M protein